MRIRILLVWLSTLALLWGCSSGGGDGETPGEDTSFGNFDTIPGDAVLPEDASAPGDATEDLGLIQDVPVPQDTAPDGPAMDLPPVEDVPSPEDTPLVEDIPTDTGPAPAFAPCLEDEDCESGLCGWHFGDRVCLPKAEGACDEGLAPESVQAGPDPLDTAVYCVSRYSHLCLPCWSDADCQDELTVNHRCVHLGSIGGFCATVSEVPGADPVCPEGTIVSNTLKLVGDDPAGPHAGIVSGCVPPMGICDCTVTAAILALDTYCFSGSDEAGWCMGERLCTGDGLAACTAAPPSEEFCDGVDNDCDGVTDEGLCDDGNACTEDSCDGTTGCVFAPLTGTPCSDDDLCTEEDVCAAGVCAGTPLVLDDGNPCTETTCAPLTGVQVIFLDVACDDGDICTTDDVCAAGVCAGDFDPPGPPPEEPCMGWTCDGVGGWLVVPVTGDPCEDGDPCSLNDSCDAGICLPGAVDPCDDGNTCTTDTCAAGLGCAHAPVPDCCGNGVTDAGEECDDGNQVDGDGCDMACQEVEVSSCADGADTVSVAPAGTMMLCDDPTDVTCEEDFATLCPTGWHLCSREEFNARNEGWTHPYASTKGLGTIHCRNSGGAGHFTLFYDSDITSFAQDSTVNCGYGSSRESCPSTYGCNETQHWALCCAPGASCGNSVVDSPEETCDDGNDDETDDCLKNCTTRMCPGGPGG